MASKVLDLAEGFCGVPGVQISCTIDFKSVSQLPSSLMTRLWPSVMSCQDRFTVCYVSRRSYLVHLFIIRVNDQRWQPSCLWDRGRGFKAGAECCRVSLALTRIGGLGHLP